MQHDRGKKRNNHSLKNGTDIKKLPGEQYLSHTFLKREEEDIRLWQQAQKAIAEIETGDLPILQDGATLDNGSKATLINSFILREMPIELYTSVSHVKLAQWGHLITDQVLSNLAAHNTRINQNQFKCSNQGYDHVIISDELVSPDMEFIKFYSNTTTKSYATLKLEIPRASNISDTGLMRIAHACTALRALNIAHCPQISDTAMRAVAMQNPELEDLDISDCFGIRGAGLVAISESCPKLKRLCMSNSPASESWVIQRVAVGIPCLVELDISGSIHVKDESMRTFGRSCKLLRKLNVSNCCEISDVGILAITESCSQLEYLDISRRQQPYKITDVSLLSLSERCVHLNTLIAHGNEFLSDVGINWLAGGCHDLQTLNVARCFKITDNALRSLGESCHELASLNISGLKQISDVGIRYIASGCHKLRALNVSGLHLLRDGVKREFGYEGLQALLHSCRHLEHLSLQGCIQVGARTMHSLGRGIDPITELPCPEYAFQLKSLNLSEMPKMKARQCLQVLFESACGPSLVSLNMSKCENLDDHVLHFIGANCSSLKVLNLSQCKQISSRGITSMCKAKKALSLRDIDLSECVKINDLALLALSESGMLLEKLNFKECVEITETGLAWITSRIPTIMQVNVFGCTCISKPGLKSMIISSGTYVQVVQDSNNYGIYPVDYCVEKRFVKRFSRCYGAVLMIQCAYRVSVAREELRSRREKRDRIYAASKIQSWWQGRAARAFFYAQREIHRRLMSAALKLQRYFRMRHAIALVQRMRVEHEEKRLTQYALKLQCAWRSKMARNNMVSMRHTHQRWTTKRDRAATAIQAAWRGRQSRRQSVLFRYMRIARQEKRTHSAIIIQCMMRSTKARMEVTKRKTSLKFLVCRKHLSAMAIQAQARRHMVYMEQLRREQEGERREMAALRIQCRWRQRTDTFAVQLLRQANYQIKLEKSARMVQAAWRGKRARDVAFLRRAMQKYEQELKEESAIKIQAAARRKLARNELARLQQEQQDVFDRYHALESWAATQLQKLYRGRVGRREASVVRDNKKRRWKEMFDYEQDRPFYYNQISGEVRWRKPQDLLDLMPKPSCDNCTTVLATIECASCDEMFCDACWGLVHSGGQRKAHTYRSLYDIYGKRVDYGDGEWPSIWRTEIEQDEILGWQRKQRQAQRESGAEVTAGIPGLDKSGAWTKYFDETHQIDYYYNATTGVSQYEVPDGYESPVENMTQRTNM